jgi:hypothetical protein
MLDRLTYDGLINTLNHQTNLDYLTGPWLMLSTLKFPHENLTTIMLKYIWHPLTEASVAHDGEDALKSKDMPLHHPPVTLALANMHHLKQVKHNLAVVMYEGY